jgi:GNAT superfamily N-acetyltransferase
VASATMIGALKFRLAEAGDARILSELLAELGYPAPPEEIPARLISLAASPKVLVLVATVDEEVAGLITTHVYSTIHAQAPVALITALVVSSRHRGRGIGSALVVEAEQWAIGNGVRRISVGSGLQRIETHGFYEARGYARSGIRFAKILAQGQDTPR